MNFFTSKQVLSLKDRLVTLLSHRSFRWIWWWIDLYQARHFQRQNLSSLKLDRAALASHAVIVFYRIYPQPNQKSPIFKDDKFRLTQICLDSFTTAFKSIKPYVVFLLDSCPPSYHQLIQSQTLDHEIVLLNRAGRLYSFLAQLELAQQLPSDTLVYFAEDDYYYLPDAGPELIQALNHYDSVSLLTPLTQNRLVIINNQVSTSQRHWQRYRATCMTFGTHANLVKNQLKLFTRHGSWDHPLWSTLHDYGYTLGAPIQSLAAHLVEGQLPKGIDWESYWGRYKRNLRSTK